jgi:3-hydroxyacyl-[acyl-carrier-protein] dehydratase
MAPETDVMQAALVRLPHGPEFRFIDRLLSLDPGVRASGIYLLRGDEPFLAGHFPDAPIMPGVLMIEAIAQLAGIAAQRQFCAAEPLRLTAVRAAKIKGAVAPGQQLRVEAEITGRLGGLVQAHGSISVGAETQPIVTAQVTLSGAGE